MAQLTKQMRSRLMIYFPLLKICCIYDTNKRAAFKRNPVYFPQTVAFDSNSNQRKSDLEMAIPQSSSIIFKLLLTESQIKFWPLDLNHLCFNFSLLGIVRICHNIIFHEASKPEFLVSCSKSLNTVSHSKYYISDQGTSKDFT